MKKLAVSFVALNALDIGLTLHFVGAGVSTEINPVMVKVLALPLPLIIAYKVAVPIILVAALIAISRHIVWRWLSMRNVLILAVAGEVCICLFNLTGLIWS